jgi:signal transduction histidine kinase
VEVEVSLPSPDPQSDLRHWIITYHPVRAPQGEILGVGVMVLESTDRKRAEQRLQAELAVTRILAETSSFEEGAPKILEAIGQHLGWEWGALWNVDQERQRLYLGETWHVPALEVGAFAEATRRLEVGWNEGLPGRAWANDRPVWMPDVTSEPTFVRATSAAEANLHAAVAFPIRLGGRTLGVVEFLSCNIRPSDPALLALMASTGAQIAQFVARKRAEESRISAEAAVRGRDAFLSMATHELGNPLTSLYGYADITRRILQQSGEQGLSPDSEQLQRLRRAADVVHLQADKLRRLVRDLHDLSRIETGKLALNPQKTDLVVLLQQLVNLAADSTYRERVVLRAPPSLEAYVDPMRIEQVVTNLLSNAIKYSPPARPVEVDLQVSDGPVITLAVQDLGAGVSLDRREYLFEQFYQAHGEGRHGGMGLGLYICKQIVTAHGGSIRAEFPANGGTRMVVTLPVLPPGETA